MEVYASGHGNGGVTLLELVISLAIVGLLAGMAGLGWMTTASAKPADSERTPAVEHLRRARLTALREGRPVTITIPHAHSVLTVTVLADGRVIGADSLGMDAVSGRAGRL